MSRVKAIQISKLTCIKPRAHGPRCEYFTFFTFDLIIKSFKYMYLII